MHFSDASQHTYPLMMDLQSGIVIMTGNAIRNGGTYGKKNEMP